MTVLLRGHHPRDCGRRHQEEAGGVQPSGKVPDGGSLRLDPENLPEGEPCDLARFDVFPVLGRLGLKTWEEENHPVLTTKGWLQLVIRIANNNLTYLQQVFNMAKKQLNAMGITYVPSGTRDAVGELLMAKNDWD